jgi:hypothetical protein
MTSISVEALSERNERARARLGRIVRYELAMLRDWALALVVALPLTLLWTDGVLFALGVGYALLYTGVMVVPTALHLLLIYDALRVVVGRPAAVAPWVLGLAELGRIRFGPRAHRRIPVWTWIGVMANPTGTLAAEFWGVAIRIRPGAWDEVRREARQFAEAVLERQVYREPPQIVAFEGRVWRHELERAGAAC